jgi:mono/diheme cytochrome c family protein
MCVRCHAADTPKDLRRARFNAEALDSIDSDLAEAIRTRIHLPHDSPEVMPPQRAGRLTPEAIARIEAFLANLEQGRK